MRVRTLVIFEDQDWGLDNWTRMYWWDGLSLSPASVGTATLFYQARHPGRIQRLRVWKPRSRLSV